MDLRAHPDAKDPWAESLRAVFGVLFLAIGVMALGWMWSGIRQVPADKRAAVLRFGVLDHVQGSGLVAAWPHPFGDVVLLPAADASLELRVSRLDPILVQQTAIERGHPIGTDPRFNVAFFLTGDAGLVQLSVDAFYRVSDPAAYLLAEERLDALVQPMIIASALSVASGRSLDGIVATGPRTSSSSHLERLRADLLREGNRRLAMLRPDGGGLGIELTRVDLVAMLPDVAKAAFDQVLVSGQEADRMIAEARTQAETWRQVAEQNQGKLLDNARALADETVSRASAQTAEVFALAGRNIDGAMLDRIYLDRIGPIIHKANRVDTVDPSGAGRLILPGAAP